MRRLTPNKLCQKIINDKNERSLFFIRGLGDSDKSFLKIARELRGYENTRIVSINLPGCGINRNVEISFDSAVREIREIVRTGRTRENILVGHSAGGLALLLACVELHLPPADRIIVIEPSITAPDFDFFALIQERPIGKGYKSLIEGLRIFAGAEQSKEYLGALLDCRKSTLRRMAKQVYLNFWRYGKIIEDSSMRFTYIYGKRSSDVAYREAMGLRQNIEVICFEEAGHWAHIDASDRFLEVIDRI